MALPACARRSCCPRRCGQGHSGGQAGGAHRPGSLGGSGGGYRCRRWSLLAPLHAVPGRYGPGMCLLHPTLLEPSLVFPSGARLPGLVSPIPPTVSSSGRDRADSARVPLAAWESTQSRGDSSLRGSCEQRWRCSAMGLNQSGRAGTAPRGREYRRSRLDQDLKDGPGY